MAKTAHSYAKRQREIEKKRKADEKRARKLNKGKAPVEDDAAGSVASAEDGAVADVAAVEDDAAAAPPSPSEDQP